MGICVTIFNLERSDLMTNFGYEQLLLKDDRLLDKSLITSFTSLEPSYMWTNEKMNLYPKDNYKGKNVLTVTSSADHILNAVLNGADNIDAFDINLYSKYIAALKIAMIRKYDYDSFSNFINSFNKTGRFDSNCKKTNFLYDIQEYLTEKEMNFWLCYQRLIFQKKLNFDDIIYLTGDFRNNLYYERKFYKELKQKLKNTNINYIDSDILNIKEHTNRFYDVIFLSNIIEYVLPSNTKVSIDRYNKLINTLDSILNIGGVLYGYIFSDDNNYKLYLHEEGKFVCLENIIENEKQTEKLFTLTKVK